MVHYVCGLEKCLFVYNENEWNNIISKLQQIPFTNKDARIFMRMFLSGATECELDNNGRITITNPLMNYIQLFILLLHVFLLSHISSLSNIQIY